MRARARGEREGEATGSEEGGRNRSESTQLHCCCCRLLGLCEHVGTEQVPERARGQMKGRFSKVHAGRDAEVRANERESQEYERNRQEQEEIKGSSHRDRQEQERQEAKGRQK
jgi:hypothetical protein